MTTWLLDQISFFKIMKRPEFNLRRTFGFVGVAMITVLVLQWGYSDLINMPEYITQLAVGLSLIAIGIAYWSFKPDIENIVERLQHTTSDKKDHTKDLVDKIYQRLTTIALRNDRHGKLGLYVYKNETAYLARHDIIFLPNDENLEPVKRLPTPYFDWALEHLKEKNYKKMLDLWNKIKEPLDDYNSKVTIFKQTLENKIRTKIETQFENFKEQRDSSDSEHLYFLSNIMRRVENIIQNQDDVNSAFSDLIIDRYAHGTWTVCPKDYNIVPFLVSTEQKKLDIEKLCQILIDIINDSDIISQNNNLEKLRENVWNYVKPFTNDLDKLVRKLNARMPLAGKCEGCS